ncbi:hydrolase 1, exosortase A system-associated [Novosphingobium sp. Fuku2-ISO-50]|uniref:hydrolase 1, exosortase A system-associated n=1 Tax=Novosphingobium sp. Fuku2-ISO-50 TaxID=1739114 RepID=UPI00076D397A|nr:hydrolase 1, exosortase A system-associated [Novosphingobium sp. Fuku2-ISO-50]KUR79311.1 thioesterase [Novosphingobium sp. Fuku2-ISO-50]
MSRRPIAFSCGPDTLYGMLDCAGAHGMTGLLIVSGGSEIRAGAFGGMAHLAARLAETGGVPVFRFDRRGIGDSDGENGGWQGSQDDIAAALAAFRAALPGMRRVVGFGICDAASALMLYGAGLDGLVLANPWTLDDADDDAAGHTPGALRRRYLTRLADPRALWRLLSGRIDLRKLFRGLGRAVQRSEAPSPLVDTLRSGLARFAGPVTLLIAAGDRVGQRFGAVWPNDDPRVMIHPTGSHTFADNAGDWLFDRLIEATASRH